MNHERHRSDGRGRRDPSVLPGLIASLVLHALLVLLNPVMETPRHVDGGVAGTPSGPAAQFSVLSLSREGEAAIRVEALPVTSSPPVSAPLPDPGAGPGDAGREGPGEGIVEGRVPGVAERLRSNVRPFSPPVEETNGERAIREARERVARAGAELGPLAPNGVIVPSGGGIRIPFGFKPPGPAQTVPPPPLPDSILRRDSMRAAARAAARRDSIRAARADTARLRNVKPRPRIEFPRVRPDTTAFEP